MKSMMIIWYSLTGGSRALAEAAKAAADRVEEIACHCHHADDVTAEMMLSHDGYIFAFPENLAAIAGVMKAAFDRLYYPCLGRIEGRPYALLVCAGSDGRNAVAQAERIATGWRLKKIADSEIINTHAQTAEEILAPKIVAEPDLEIARRTGALVANGLAMGIF